MHHDFPKHNLPERQVKVKQVYKGTNARFEGSTEAKDAFVEHHVKATRVKNVQKYIPNNAPFQGVTTTQVGVA